MTTSVLQHTDVCSSPCCNVKFAVQCVKDGDNKRDTAMSLVVATAFHMLEQSKSLSVIQSMSVSNIQIK